MNIAKLNTASLDDKTFIIKRDTSGGGSDTPTPSKPKYTGHADAEGLRAIGWTDEDIAYYQENGVNWNEEDDQYHLVSDDNKALYGVLTAGNISSYKDRIVYLPKIDTSAVTSMNQKFSDCYLLVSIPMLDTSKVATMVGMFSNCYSLTTIPMLDTSQVHSVSNMFYRCGSLQYMPPLNLGNLTTSETFLRGCSKLSVVTFDKFSSRAIGTIVQQCSSLTSLDIEHIDDWTGGAIFYECYALQTILLGKIGAYTQISNSFYKCYSLTTLRIKGLHSDCDISYSSLLSKDSLLYLINNEAATSAITIKLASYAYTRLAEDADVVAALTNHPNISLAK